MRCSEKESRCMSFVHSVLHQKTNFCLAAGAGDQTTDPQTRQSLPEEIIEIIFFLFVFCILFLTWIFKFF